jgi:hypothetical protein
VSSRGTLGISSISSVGKFNRVSGVGGNGVGSGVSAYPCNILNKFACPNDKKLLKT